MNKTIYFLIVILLMIISIASVISLLYLEKSESSSFNPSEALETCKTISESDGKSINLVFFSSEKDAEKYSKYLSEIKPFDESENFNVHAITDYKPECELYNDIALLCYSKELLKKASSCPNDYVVVLGEESSSIRSSSYMNVISLNLKHPLSVFAHEFGHAFANFADEYVPAKIPTGAKNCVSSCEKFKGEKDGCFEGCSEEDYFRSVKNGVMRTLSSNYYGIFNENLIKQLITKQKIQITANVIEEEQKCSDEKYYLIKGIYDEEKIEIIEKTIEHGCAGTNGNGDAVYSIYNKQNISLLSENFNPEFIFTDSLEQNETQGDALITNQPFFLKIPIIPEAERLKISINKKTAETTLKNMGNQPCKV